MNRQNQIYITDCSVLEADQNYNLSFSQKIELCRLVDKLGVDCIDLSPIRQKKIDRLLIKSISSAVRSAVVGVPVDIRDPESISLTWDALKEAGKPRLQVSVPVSSVQMEYLLHMKSEAVIAGIASSIGECRKLTEDVEFIAQDASRSDPAFLVRALQTAIQAGATTVTLCDTAGMMMPEDVTRWIEALKKELPLLLEVRIGYFCSGELNMADANAVAAIRAGVREIKATSCRGTVVSLFNIVRILNVKGKSLDVSTHVGTEQIRRITGQVETLFLSSGKKSSLTSDPSETASETDMILSRHDGMEAVIGAASKLGYDLNAEDQEKVWKSFREMVEKKDNITLRELEAIIAAEAMQVPPAYHDVSYVISTSNQTGAMARMKLKYKDREIEGVAAGDGAIDAAFNSIEQATGRHFELDDFQIRSVTEGREAMGETIVRLRWEGKLFSGRGISTDIVGAGIMAYINAVNKIIYEEDEV